MGCIVVVIVLIVPRVVMFIAFLTTDWFGRAFETRLWPIVGFVFMPYSTLAYVAAMLNNHHALTGAWLALLIASAMTIILYLIAIWFAGRLGIDFK